MIRKTTESILLLFAALFTVVTLTEGSIPLKPRSTETLRARGSDHTAVRVDKWIKCVKITNTKLKLPTAGPTLHCCGTSASRTVHQLSIQVLKSKETKSEWECLRQMLLLIAGQFSYFVHIRCPSSRRHIRMSRLPLYPRYTVRFCRGTLRKYRITFNKLTFRWKECVLFYWLYPDHNGSHICHSHTSHRPSH